MVATWDRNRTLTMGDLEAQVSETLRDLETRYRMERYDMLAGALDAALERELLEAERVAQGLSTVAALVKREVDARTEPPNADELRSEFEAFRAEVPSATFAEAESHLRRELTKVNREARYRAFLRELRERHGVNVSLPYPEIPRVDVPVRAHDPTMGPASATVTVVEFAEYQCYYCRQMAATLERIVDDYDGKVRVVFKDFPLRAHGRARAAAVAAHCAGQQGEYWSVGRRLYQFHGQLSEDDLHGVAEAASLDMARWSSCRADPMWQARIDEDIRDGRSAGVEETPTFFINGVKVTGAQPYEQLASLIDRELAGAR